MRAALSVFKSEMGGGGGSASIADAAAMSRVDLGAAAAGGRVRAQGAPYGGVALTGMAADGAANAEAARRELARTQRQLDDARREVDALRDERARAPRDDGAGDDAGGAALRSRALTAEDEAARLRAQLVEARRAAHAQPAPRPHARPRAGAAKILADADVGAEPAHGATPNGGALSEGEALEALIRAGEFFFYIPLHFTRILLTV